MKKKLILVDADGVLLDWEFAFSVWMEEHGFAKQDGHQFEYDIGVRYGIDREQSFKLIKMFDKIKFVKLSLMNNLKFL